MVSNNPRESGRGPQRRRVLEGHYQRGKRFVPLLLEYMHLIETPWLDDILPELLWIALMNSRFGIKRGTELCVELAKTATSYASRGQGAFVFMSEYGQLTPNEQDHVKVQLTDSGILGHLTDALQVLATHYPECPLTFLWSTEMPPPEKQDSLQKLKQLILELADRRGVAATFMQAVAVYVYFLNDKLIVPSGSTLANFPAIEEYPETDLSRMVASSIRASVNGFSASLNLSADWRRYFWDRGSTLEPCEAMRYDSG